MSDTAKQEDWTKPAAMAIPKGGFFEDKVEQGGYGPLFPKTPACYGFSVIAKIIPGMEEHLYNNAKVMEKAIAYDPTASALFAKTGIRATFEALEGWPADYASNPAAIVKFFRDHQCPSFLEYSEYPYVSCEEIKKALKMKAAFSNMLDQMQ